jgi:predicted AlkP superfamily pyrophosphatase or phosphodiesterase
MKTSDAHRRAEVLLRTLAAVAVLTQAARLPAQSPSTPPAPAGVTRHVVVISIDGLRPDAIEGANATHLRQLMREGAWTLRAQTIVPSRTLPSHTSMLTGVGPEVHGITWNEDHTGRTGQVEVPTVFDVAQQAGLTTAGLFGKAKFRHLIRRDTPEWRQAPRGAEVWFASRIAPDAEAMLRGRRPNLTFVHLADPDLAGHVYGWMSLPYRMAVRRADGAVGRIVRTARRAFGDDVVVIVTADHGGSGRSHSHSTPPERTIPWIVWGRGVTPGEIATPIRTMDTAATALWLLGVPVPARWEGRPVEQAFRTGAAATPAPAPGG